MKKIFFQILILFLIVMVWRPLAATSVFFTYDDLGRLTQAMYGCETMMKYSYDDVGNRISTINYVSGTFTDTDNDSIDDAWELFYFDTLLVANTVTNYDDDGHTDLEEYLLWGEGSLDDDGLPYNPRSHNRTLIYVSKIQGCGGHMLCYQSIQQALGDMTDSGFLVIQAENFDEDIWLQQAGLYGLHGGYDAQFSSQTSFSNINGSVTIESGGLIIDRMIISGR